MARNSTTPVTDHTSSTGHTVPPKRRSRLPLLIVLLTAGALIVLILLLSRQPVSTPSVTPTPSGDAQSHLDLGASLIAENKLDQAIAEFEIALSLDPNLAEAHFRLGNAYFAQNKLDDAAAQFSQALDQDPTNVDARSNLGAVYYQRSEFQKASAEFLRALEVSRHSLQPWRGVRATGAIRCRYRTVQPRSATQARADPRLLWPRQRLQTRWAQERSHRGPQQVPGR